LIPETHSLGSRLGLFGIHFRSEDNQKVRPGHPRIFGIRKTTPPSVPNSMALHGPRPRMRENELVHSAKPKNPMVFGIADRSIPQRQTIFKVS
jgi:hypothetical protein